VTLGLYLIGGSGTGVAFAEVIKPILNAQTAVLDIIVGDEDTSPVITDMVMGSRIRRKLSTIDAVSIIDLETARILTLEPKEKNATYIDLKGLPEQKTTNYLQMLRNLIIELQDNPHFVVEELGEQEVEGQVAVGFRAKHPRVELTIWADPQTALPIRIESQEGQLFIICKNFQFDEEMDPNWFSMDAPEGYTVREAELDLFGATEEDFIEGLRIWAEMLGEGQFPDDVSVEHYVKQVKLIEEKFDQSELSDDEKVQIGLKLSRYLLFTRFFKGEGKWYYAGKGIKLGDADTAIFWYRPKDSETYRVIYGDLSVEDVAAEDLPQPLPPEPKTTTSIGYQQWSKAEFVGSQEDEWHITASGDIVVHSYIELRKGPQDTAVMPIALPYESGQLQSVTLGAEPLQYRHIQPGRYEIELPLDKLLEGQTNMECIWRLPLETFEKSTNYGNQVKLQSLIPVTFYKLTVVLEPDCNFVFSQDPSQRKFVPFFASAVGPAKTDWDVCGIGVQPRD
ncbi:MAG: hypothetical protein ACYS21_15260, partial [Planctomycetota bacterium]